MQTLFSQYRHQIAPLQQLSQQLAQRAALQQRIAACLSPQAQAALLDVSIIDNTLYLLTPNATWASRMRLSSRQLLAACADEQVTQLVVRVMPAQTENIRPLRILRTKPDESALIPLQALRAQLNDDPLAPAIERLLNALNH